ncbi:Aldo/keto reductase [Lentithecium fluviatile CBS 122367]|uniref:Aldo/keto reductase n=1 Tax=Lentithecium fluviatile CBS 122367 TaxID=1168545 RepID=A0A6G1J4N3_9PLEO|nr:Aldo/keto reductase [Lentithecium fluviatile CBS 122367]
MTQIKAVYGGGSFNPHGAFKDAETVGAALEALQRSGVTTLDTARLYPGSEALIGAQPLRTSFTIDTKIQGGFSPGSASKDAIIKDAQDSLSRVQIPHFDILYLHAPDATVPIAETLEGINEVYKKGIFKRFGLSNFTAAQVQEAYDIAKEKGYVLPSVYQGNYSPIARHLETLLFPTLRKLGFSFYAYSPLAGGFLTKTVEDLDAGAGRFNDKVIGGMYNNLYNKPSLREALAEWNSAAEKEGVSKAELAYRWVGYNSALDADLGDAVIFGASKLSQVEQTAEGLKKGGLSEEAKKKIEGIWESVKADAPVDNFGANKL